MSNTAHVSYKWSERGKQPQIEQKQYKRERLTLFGSVNPVSGEVLVQESKTGNAKEFKKYLKRVLFQYRKSNGMIHMILDNVKFHHANINILVDIYKNKNIYVYVKFQFRYVEFV